ncbi:MAG: hypothetical protein ACT4P5_10925, partial [Armatimonadota bacterium]
MRLLILGGTVFLGRHLVDAALERRHQVTLFNRGQQNPDLFPDVEKLRGDRDGNLDALRPRQWDAVIDTCGYVPRIVSASAALLADRVGHYTFISSISVYAGQGTDEDSPPGRLSMGHLLDAIRSVSGSDARLTWVDEGFLTDAGVTPWTEVPLWIPQSTPSASAMLSVNSLKAIVAGLTYRPLADTIRDTLAWDVSRP